MAVLCQTRHKARKARNSCQRTQARRGSLVRSARSECCVAGKLLLTVDTYCTVVHLFSQGTRNAAVSLSIYQVSTQTARPVGDMVQALPTASVNSRRPRVATSVSCVRSHEHPIGRGPGGRDPGWSRPAGARVRLLSAYLLTYLLSGVSSACRRPVFLK